jgi:hypothetical protein
MSNPDWPRLANLMAARRRDLEQAAGHRSGIVQIPDPQILAAKFHVSHKSMAQRVEIDHHWTQGSVDSILAGGDPTLLDGIPEAMKPKPRRKGITPTVRARASVTERDIDDAVVAARAVVELAGRRDALEAECELLEAKVTEREEWLRAAEQRAKETHAILTAVTMLHFEAIQVSCSDGCCHEGLGYCQECGEPYPCTTAHVADGKTAEEAKRLLRQQREQAKPAAVVEEQ